MLLYTTNNKKEEIMVDYYKSLTFTEQLKYDERIIGFSHI